MTASSSIDPLPLGTGLLLLGTGEAAITFLSLSQNDVTYARTEWSALLSMLLAAPASVLYVLHRGAQSSWWRAFWTVGLIAYLLHFWCAVFGTYNGSFELDPLETRLGCLLKLCRNSFVDTQRYSDLVAR